MKIVIDTNVLVSAMLSPQGAPAAVVRSMMAGIASVLFDERILFEYRDVLARGEFGFDAVEVANLLEYIETNGELVLAPPFNLTLPDPSDGMFIEVAVASNADCLVTGNLKHFPTESLQGVPVVTPRTFCGMLAI